MPQASLVCTASRRAPIFDPVILTFCLLYYCRATWKRLDAVHRPCCSTRWFRCKAVFWSARRQEASHIHAVLDWVLRGGFLTSFQRSAKPASSSSIGPLFGAAMGHMDLPLRYRIFCLSLHPLSSGKIIPWSVETLGYLILTLYKY